MMLSTGFFRKILIAAAAIAIATSAFAQQLSPEQIAQFKQLPKAQQEALARQYGVDLSGMSGTSNANRLQNQSVEELANSNGAAVQQAQAQPNEYTNKNKLKRFGENLFDANISTFAPVANAPVPENYRLGPDDTLLLQVYGKQNNTYELLVSREGNVNLPDLGPLNVAGLSFNQASNLIRNRISEANIGLQAAVTMGQLRTINIFVAGEARNPGMYAVSALTSVTQALFVSGGVSDIGSLRDIRVTRSGQTVARFDLYNLLLKGDNANDINLQHGDVVFVAPAGAIVAIEGQVRRPAYYELAKNETLGQLVTMAGGLQPSAHVNAVSLQRAGPNGRELVNLNLTEPSAQDFPLRSGDKLVVPVLSARVKEQVSIVGAVSRPGTYAWKGGMQLHHLLGNVWSDLLQTTDTDYALIVRRINNRGDVDVIQINLLDAIDNSQSGKFVPVDLQPQDIVLVFNQLNLTFEREHLNNYIRTNVRGQINTLSENAVLAGDIATNFFKIIEGENALLSSSQFKSEQQEISQKGLVEKFVADILQHLYVNPEYLALSKHMNRRELMFSLLQTLRKQSSDQQKIPVISISGDVKVPGEYPLSRGGNIAMLIKAAGGLNDSAYLPRAELSRFLQPQTAQNSVEQKNININLSAILKGEESDIELTSRDRINIFATPDWSKVRLVSIRGEVRFPGTYQALKGEKLSDIIKRAGGFTSDAYTYGAVFTRDAIKRREMEQARQLLAQLKSDVASRALTNQNNLNPVGASSLALLDELQTLEPVGRMVIDLDKIMLGRADYDIEVENQDSLTVPRVQNSVTIMGEVQHPGSHRFRDGLSVNDYLALAGGSRKRADEGRVFVIRADGSVMVPSNNSWFKAENDQLKPGDTIIMPLDTEYKDSLSAWAQITQVFYQTFVALAALRSF